MNHTNMWTEGMKWETETVRETQRKRLTELERQTTGIYARNSHKMLIIIIRTEIKTTGELAVHSQYSPD